MAPWTSCCCSTAAVVAAGWPAFATVAVVALSDCADIGSGSRGASAIGAAWPHSTCACPRGPTGRLRNYP